MPLRILGVAPKVGEKGVALKVGEKAGSLLTPISELFFVTVGQTIRRIVKVIFRGRLEETAFVAFFLEEALRSKLVQALKSLAY